MANRDAGSWNFSNGGHRRSQYSGLTETERQKRLLSCVVGKKPASEDRPAEAELAVIDLGPVKKMPVVINWGQLQEDFARGIRAMTTEKPVIPAVKALSELPEARRKIFSAKVVANNRLIQPILNLGWGAFDGRARGAMISDVVGGKLYLDDATLKDIAGDLGVE